MLDAQIGCKRLLEIVVLLPHNECAALQNRENGRVNLWLQVPVLGFEVDKWDSHLSPHLFGIDRNGRAGTPATIVSGGTSYVTPLPAPTIARSQIVAEGVWSHTMFLPILL